MGRLRTVTRRTFMVASAAIVGGVAFGYYKYKKPYANPLLDNLADGESALTPYVLINQQGITIITPRAEMGQGIHTTLAAMVAEELDVELDDVLVEHGPASGAYFNEVAFEEAVPYAMTDHSVTAETLRGLMRIPSKLLGMQITGGSSSTPDAYPKMRLAGAAARHCLVEAAAARLAVAASELDTDNGAVIAKDGTRISYVELAADAATIDVPDELSLKSRSEWKLLGRSLPRVDMVGKSTGTAEYAIDVRLPEMLYATIRANPRLGGELISYDDTEAKTMSGVRFITRLDNAVAVVATNTWYALQAAKAITFKWGDAPYPATTDEMIGRIASAIDDDLEDSQYRDDGDVETALVEADVIETEYRVPFLAHATMEPMNATVLFTGSRLDIWAGNQLPTQVVVEGVAITELDAENIHVHTTYMGGGFGRRSEMDFIKQTISLAKVMPGTPVKLTWSREEDMTHDQYRPAAIARFRGAVNAGMPSAFDLQLGSVSVLDSQMSRLGLPAAGPDITIVQSAWDQPYAIPNYRVTGYRAKTMIPVTSWRSVGASQNGFFHESSIDELAIAAGRDPLEMRISLMAHEPSRKVLEAVAEMSGWGEALPEGHGRGVAFVYSFGVPVAEVIEVAATDRGIRIVNAWAAVDVGTALDPRNIEAQVQSGINFGLTAAIMGEITVADGEVQQNNFHTYNGIRINQAPPITVKVLENGEKIRGIGEPGLPPAAPALANAIFAATGQRIRELPFKKHVDFV